MYIEKNNYDCNYPFLIYGSWGDKIHATKKDLENLKKEIEKVLTDTEKGVIINIERKK